MSGCLKIGDHLKYQFCVCENGHSWDQIRSDVRPIKCPKLACLEEARTIIGWEDDPHVLLDWEKEYA